MSKLRQNDLATARRTDPITSHETADEKNKSGTITRDQLGVLKSIYWHPGWTAKELDMRCEAVGKAHRRSRELEAKGWITRDKSKGGMRMWVTDAGKEVLRG